MFHVLWTSAWARANATLLLREELCKLRADINHAASEQRTALHFAASSQCVDIVRLLLLGLLKRKQGKGKEGISWRILAFWPDTSRSPPN